MRAEPKSKSQELASTPTPTNDTPSGQVDQPTAEFKPVDPLAESSAQAGDDSTHLWSSADHIVSANDVDVTATFDPSTASAGKQSAMIKVGGYEILGELGRGGMGVVYKAYQRGLKRTVALKMILGGALAGPEQLKRFLTEAHSVAHLQHPNIVQVFEATNNATEATRRSDRMKVYIQEVIQDLLKVNTFDNPRMRSYVENALGNMLPILSEIIGELPETEQAAPTRASGLSLMARGLQETGNVSQALAKLQELVEFGEKRLTIKGNSDAARLNLSKFLRDLAAIQLESNRNFPKHFELLYRAEALAQDAIDHPRCSPDDNKGLLEFYQARAQLAEVKNRLAAANYRNGDPMKARELFDESTRLYTEILEAIPSGQAFEPKSGSPLSEQAKKTFPNAINGYIDNNNLALSSIYFRTGEPQKAEKELTRVVAATKQSFDANPTLPSIAMQYVGYLGVFSEVKTQSSDPKAVLEKLDEAATIADRFYKQDNRSADKRRRTALAYYRVGQWREMLDIETAQESFKRCLELRTEAASLDASNDRKQLDLMLASAAVGDGKTTLGIVDKYLAFPLLDNEMRVDMARALSRLSSKVKSPEDAELRSRAVKVLEAAVKHDYKDHVYLSNDLDLRALHHVQEFNSLIGSLH